MHNRQQENQQVKIQPESANFEPNSGQNKQKSPQNRKQAKKQNNAIRKNKRRTGPLPINQIHHKLVLLVDQGKTVEEAVQLLKNHISLSSAKRLLQKVRTNPKFAKIIRLKEHQVRQKKVQTEMNELFKLQKNIYRADQHENQRINPPTDQQLGEMKPTCQSQRKLAHEKNSNKKYNLKIKPKSQAKVRQKQEDESFNKALLNMSYLNMYGKIQSNDYKSLMDTLCMGQLIKSRLSKLRQEKNQEALKRIDNIYQSHSYPIVVQIRFPSQSQEANKIKTEVKLQE